MEQPDVMDVVDFEEDEGTAAVGGGSSPVARASESQGDDDMNNGANLALHCDGEQGNNGNAAGASADGGATGQVEDGGADVAQGDKVVADDNAATATATTAAVAAPYEYPTGPIKIDQLDLLPANNVYESWISTPGIPGRSPEDIAVVIKFEGMGAQDLTVGLSHKPTQKGPMYQLIIGNKGNLQVDLEKRQGRRVETVASAAGLLCASNNAHKYWVAVMHGKIDFGVGEWCGQHTVLSFRDKELPIEVRYAGFTCLRHRALFTSIVLEAEADGVQLPEPAITDLEFVRAKGCDEGFSGEDKAALDSALELYQKECENMKRRARKFGGTYTPPFLQDWVPWTLVKRLSWNRDLEGGIDRESKEEREKRKQRADRFGDSAPDADTTVEGPLNPIAKRVDPEMAEMMTEEKRFARSQKFGNPDQMWNIQAEEQGLRPSDIFCEDPDRADPEPMASLYPHKIHIFSLDKVVCKQIRDNDVKAYFEGFSPKYVEWLSDWSFNVVFQDEEEAKKAAAAKSFALPEALPPDIRETVDLEEGSVEMGEMGWRLGVPMCKVRRDRFGLKGQWVRLLLRCAEAQDILLERPQEPAKPEGPILGRPGGSKLPPAVRDATTELLGDNPIASLPTITTADGNRGMVMMERPLSTSRDVTHDRSSIRDRGSGGGGGRNPRDRRNGRGGGDARGNDRDAEYDSDGDGRDEHDRDRRRHGVRGGGGSKRRRREQEGGRSGGGEGKAGVDLDPEDMMDRALSAPRDEKKRRGGARDRDRDRDRDRRQKETSTPADEGAGPPAVTPVAPASSASAPSQLNDIDTPQK